jgi:cyclic pyranopterin phosphate synthase
LSRGYNGNLIACRICKGEKVGQLIDRFGRTFPYIRLSLTDICNYKCSYCLPNGYKKSGKANFLSTAEIYRLLSAFAELGTWKVRLTGGEPTLRKDFLDILNTVSSVPGIKKIALTTNGYKLEERAKSYYDAGLRSINISIDSFNPSKFKNITGHNRLLQTLKAVKLCSSLGYESIKLNAVLLKNVNENELDEYLEFLKDSDLSIRFIELMQTGDNAAFFQKYHISSEYISSQLLNSGWELLSREEGDGPAAVYAHKNYKGTIGLIAPYSKSFCDTCNRLRISSNGDMHLCLFGQGGYPLRSFLSSDDQKNELQEKIIDLMKFKLKAHNLYEGDSGIREHLASIGG